MTDKVRTAFYGKDLRVEYKDYPLNSAGNKIMVTSGGEGHFMPDIGPTTFLDLPIRKRYIFFGAKVYARTFFAPKLATQCVDFFPVGMVYGPDPEELKKANAVVIAKEIGSDREKGTPWYIWFILLLNVVIFLLALQTAGVIR